MEQGWTRFNRYLYKHWKLQAIVILLGLISVPTTLLNPYLTKLVIDKAYGGKDLKLFLVLAAIGGSIFVINSLMGLYSSYLSRRINRYVYLDMSNDFFRHLQHLPLSFFNNQSTGEHVYRLSADVSSVSQFVCSAIPQLVTFLPRLLFILAIVFYLNWKIALLASLLVPISYIHPYFFGKWEREIVRRTRLKAQNISKGLHEVFSHIHLIKALGKEEYEIKRFKDDMAKKVEFELQNAKLSYASSFSSSILSRVLSGIIVLYGGYQVIKGIMTLGSLTAIMIYLAQFMGLLSSIGAFYKTVAVSSVTRQRLAEILDVKPARDIPGATSYAIKEGRIVFKDVLFGYRKNNLILKDINFSVEPASKIALVGPSGCGKTTILSLILRLYEPEKGAVFIDGINTRKIKLDSFKSQIGIALQEPLLWNDTVGNNILYGAKNPTYADMIKAAELSEAHKFIMNLTNKYDTAIGERACKISEGQKQRIAIARALIKKPKILILDEAMSSLDSRTEDKIIDNIRHELKDSTIIVVSHRLSAAKKMDLVYFLADSTSIKAARHEKLLEGDPGYRQLFASQLS